MTTIITKNSSTAGAAPLAADLVQGELAVNVTDKRLFTEDSVGTVVELGINPSSITVASTATLNGNTVIGNADTDTITQTASYVAGTQLKSAKTTTSTLNLAAYDTDGAAYTNLVTLTASTAPTLGLTSTGVGTINNMSVGATTASTGAFTTLSASGTTTLSGNQVISVTDNTNAALRITQLGTGNALLVEDSSSPDSTPFVITAAGGVGIGTSSPGALLTAASSSSSDGAVLRLERIGTSVFGGEKYGQIQFFGNDSSTSADGVRAFVNADSTGPNGESNLVFGTASQNAPVTERMRIDNGGNLLVGNTTGTSKITATGVVESTTGGFKFPDGTTQTTAAGSSIGSLRAWVNFNGTGTVAIRASGNVSSITDNGTGDYTVNFSTAMSDANYNVVATVNNQNTNGICAAVKSASIGGALTNMTTSAVQVIANNTSSLFDPTLFSVSIFH